jgi:transposase
MGYHGDAHGFRHWVRIRLRDGVAASSGACRKVRLDWKPPSPRQALRLLVSSIDTMPPLDRQFVASLRSACPEVATAADLAQRFHALLGGRDIDALDPWLAEAATGSLAPFARGLLRDIDAVRAALTLPWSTGPVEGKINKLKLIKRSMYGRAGLDLLRARIMA